MKKADKVYVKVRFTCDEDGNLVPDVMYWPNDDEYIEYAMDNPSKPVPRHAKKSGGHGHAIDFECKGHRREIFFEPKDDGFFRCFVQCDKRAEGVRDD